MDRDACAWSARWGLCAARVGATLTFVGLVSSLLAVTGCVRPAPRNAPPAAPPSSPPPAPPSASAAALPEWAETQLARSTATAALGPASVEIVISRSELRLGHDQRVLAKLPPPAERSRGFGGELKASPNDLKLLLLAGALAQMGPSVAQPARARVVADASTPYRILIEVLYTLGQSGVQHYELPVRGATGVAAITVTPPARMSPADLPTHRLNLTVLVVDGGISVKGGGGNVGPGCTGVAPGLAFPRAGGAYDWPGVRACAEKLRASDPAFAHENQVVVVADSNIELETVVALMDSLRTSAGGQPLFTVTHFGIAK